MLLFWVHNNLAYLSIQTRNCTIHTPVLTLCAFIGTPSRTVTNFARQILQTDAFGKILKFLHRSDDFLGGAIAYGIAWLGGGWAFGRQHLDFSGAWLGGGWAFGLQHLDLSGGGRHLGSGTSTIQVRDWLEWTLARQLLDFQGEAHWHSEAPFRLLATSQRTWALAGLRRSFEWARRRGFIAICHFRPIDGKCLLSQVGVNIDARRD